MVFLSGEISVLILSSIILAKINKAYPIGLLLSNGLQVIIPPYDEDFDEDFSDEKLAKGKPQKKCTVPLRVIEMNKEFMEMN